MTAAYLCTFEKRFNTKERLFMVFAWCGKATVPATLAPVFLQAAQAIHNEEYIAYGLDI
jgi:hypothetical protein